MHVEEKTRVWWTSACTTTCGGRQHAQQHGGHFNKATRACQKMSRRRKWVCTNNTLARERESAVRKSVLPPRVSTCPFRLSMVSFASLPLAAPASRVLLLFPSSLSSTAASLASGGWETAPARQGARPETRVAREGWRHGLPATLSVCLHWRLEHLPGASACSSPAHTAAPVAAARCHGRRRRLVVRGRGVGLAVAGVSFTAALA